MPALTAAATLSLQLEQVSKDIPEILEADNSLDKLIQDNGRAEMVSTRAYRIPVQTSLPGSYARVNLDSNTVPFPAGGASTYTNGTVQPETNCVPIEWTKLSQLVDKGPVAITNAVDKELGNAMRTLRKKRDIMLCVGDSTGTVATVLSVAGSVVTLDPASFGAHCLDLNQYIMVFNGSALRPSGNAYGSSAQITAIANKLGGTQTITLDTVPAGTVAGDLIKIDGVTNGAPVSLNGILTFLNNAGTGTTLGTDRSINQWVVANGYSAGNASPTLPLLRLPIDQIKQSLGEDAVTVGSLVIHTTMGQVANYEQLGEQLLTIPLSGGTADSLDLLFRGKKSVDGHPLITNVHAHAARMDYMFIKAWGKVQYGKPPFWYDMDGMKVFPVYGTNGSPTAAARSFLIDTTNYYVDNFWGQSSLYQLKPPTGYV